jgi:hypothetical protein
MCLKQLDKLPVPAVTWPVIDFGPRRIALVVLSMSRWLLVVVSQMDYTKRLKYFAIEDHDFGGMAWHGMACCMGCAC